MAFMDPNNTSHGLMIDIYSFSSNRTYSLPAFLTEFNDQRTTNWASQEIYGRMDPIYTYKNTVRKISIGLDVISYNLEQSMGNNNTINFLQDSLYPVYDERPGELGAANLSSPPLFRIKIMNLLKSDADPTKGCLGWVDNFNFKPEFESGFFNSGTDIFAKLFKVAFNFNVIHEKPLGYDKNHSWRTAIPAITEETTAQVDSTPETPVAAAKTKDKDSVRSSREASRKKREERKKGPIGNPITDNLNLSKKPS